MNVGMDTKTTADVSPDWDHVQVTEHVQVAPENVSEIPLQPSPSCVQRAGGSRKRDGAPDRGGSGPPRRRRRRDGESDREGSGSLVTSEEMSALFSESCQQ